MQQIFMPDEDSAPQRIDAFLARVLPDFSRSNHAKQIRAGYVSVNDKVITKTSIKVVSGDKIAIQTEEDSPSHAAVEVPILYEDADVIVFNKPAGLLTHARTAIDTEYTLEIAASAKVKPGTPRGGIVHRLDRATTGVIIVAKNPIAYEHLQKQFAKRKAEKTYVAVVHGVVRDSKSHFKWPIERNPKQPHLFRVGQNGKLCDTRMEVLKRYDQHTFVQLKPKTGRTHQLRVHMSHYGNPIVGDSFYGKNVAYGGVLFLHAQELNVSLPSHEVRTFQALPAWKPADAK